MTTLQEALPCPFCGKQHTLQVISGQELMDENQEFWQHSESFGVVCDASMPDGKGGCGAMGGFKPTEDEAIEAWNTRTALAQQREQQPVCHGCGIPAGDVHMSTCKSGKWPSRVSNGDTAAPAPVEQRCTYCDGTGDVHSIDGEWRGTCHCAAAPAPQPAQGVPETNFGNMPVKFLVNGTRFKMSFFQNEDEEGNYTDGMHVMCFEGYEKVLDGRWVALVAAEDDCHLQSAAQPKQEPLTDDQIIDLENEVARRVGSRRALTIGFARAIEAAHGINGMVEAATRPAIDAASKQGGQLE